MAWSSARIIAGSFKETAMATRLTPLLLTLAFLFSVAGLSVSANAASPPHTAQPVTAEVSASVVAVLTGDDGVSVSLPVAAQRIVSLLPSLAEVLCDLGACDRLVGVDRYTNWPASLQKLPRMGGGLDPNLEMILSVRPDLVVMAPSSRAIPRLRALGLNVLALEPKRYAELRRTYAVLGRAVGRSDGEQLYTGLHDRLLALRARIPSVWMGARLYVEVSSELYAAAPSSFVGQTLTALGLGNAISDEFGPFPKVNPEWVVRLQPDVLVVSQASAQSLNRRPGWPQLAALKQARVCVMSEAQADRLVRPGPRLYEGAQWLLTCLKALSPPQQTTRRATPAS
ncbi:MAG: helical backbone metal receptor [Comamonadaceae bacterium]